MSFSRFLRLSDLRLKAFKTIKSDKTEKSERRCETNTFKIQFDTLEVAFMAPL